MCIHASSFLVFGLLLSLVISMEASAQNYTLDWSGFGIVSQDADVNGSADGGFIAQLYGRGTFGNGETQVVLDSAFGGFCTTDDGPSTGILLNYLAFTAITRMSNGDLLYRTMSSSPPSTACFNPNSNTAIVRAFLDIVGGTGRFEEASGSTVVRNFVDVRTGQNGITGNEEGEIFGVGDQGQ